MNKKNGKSSSKYFYQIIQKCCPGKYLWQINHVTQRNFKFFKKSCETSGAAWINLEHKSDVLRIIFWFFAYLIFFQIKT